MTCVYVFVCICVYVNVCVCVCVRVCVYSDLPAALLACGVAEEWRNRRWWTLGEKFSESDLAAQFAIRRACSPDF